MTFLEFSVYPLLEDKVKKRSKFSNLEKFRPERLALKILRVNGLSANRSAIKVV